MSGKFIDRELVVKALRMEQDLDAAAIVSMFPGAENAVEVIRCRDCQYYQSTHINGERYSACTYNILTRQHREPEDYCSRAKKREAEK